MPFQLGKSTLETKPLPYFFCVFLQTIDILLLELIDIFDKNKH